MSGRPTSDRDLIVALEALSTSQADFAVHKATEIMLTNFNQGSHRTKELRTDRLTSREREVVQLLSEGRSSKEVAAVLGISTKTTETHRANIMRKLEIHSVSELVRYAVSAKSDY